MPLPNNDEQPFEDHVDHIQRVSTSQSIFHTKNMTHSGHHIDLNASYLPNNNEQPFEDHVDLIQRVSTSQPIFHTKNLTHSGHHIDLNESHLPNKDEQLFEDHVDHIQKVSTSQSIFHTKNMTHSVRHIDLNASPSSNNDEQPFEDYVDHMQGVSTSQSIFCRIPVNTICRSIIIEMSRSSTNASLFEDTLKKAQIKDQDVMHYIYLNASPLLNKVKQPFIYCVDYMQGVSTSHVNFHTVSHDVTSEPMTIEEPLSSCNALYGASNPFDVPFDASTPSSSNPHKSIKELHTCLC